MKQLRLEFLTARDNLPLGFHAAILSFIKASVQACSDELFEEWFGNQNTTRKSYTFSCNLPQARVVDGEFILPEKRFCIFVSTSQITDFIVLYNAFLPQRGKVFPLTRNEMKLVEIYDENVTEIREREALVRMDSALLVRSHDAAANRDRFLTYSDPDFVDVLRSNIQHVLTQQRLPFAASDFDLFPIAPKKTVVWHFGLRVNANLGVYRLSGPPQLLNFLLLSGLGSATGSGHGKFHVLEQKG